MNMNSKLIAAGTVALILASCSHKNAAVSEGLTAVPVEVTPVSYMPKATLFKMSGPYADKVAVTLQPDGTLSYYPAPGDITADSEPEYIGKGWWLNRQGIGAGSVFTDWTFAQYAALPQTPSTSEIKAHIIPGARVTEFMRTDVPMTEAAGQLGRIRAQLP